MDVLLSSDSDCESFTESSSSEEQDDIESIFGGHAQSILSNLEETIGKIDDFLLFERGFMHGDIVCSVIDPSGQKGRVVGVEMFVDLESVNGKKVKDINSKKLLKVRSFSAGDYVIHGPWLGRVDKVVDSLTIVFDDGAKCEITPTDEEMIIPISPDLLEDSQYPFYPGQRVRIRRSTISSSARWLCGTWKENRDEGTVCSVDAGFVYVDWIALAPVGQNSRLPNPGRVQETKKLTLLSCFAHENWQLGDWCILKKGSNFDEIYAIVKTRTKVDVLWQNGNLSSGLDSQAVFPVGIVDAHEFWLEQCVLEKGSCDDPNVPSTRRLGVVTGVDAEERTVKVKWRSIGLNEGCDSEEETASAYELIEHPDYSYCLGDVVLRVEKEGLLDYKCYLLCIGYVKGFKDGNIEVIWANGSSSEVAPYDIVRVDKVEDSTGNPEVDEGNSAEVNREMTGCDKQPAVKEGKETLHLNGVGEEWNKYSCESSSFFLPQAAIGFFTSIASSLFGAIGSTSLSSGLNISIHENQIGVLKEIEATKYCKVCSEGPEMEIELEPKDNDVREKIEISHSLESEKHEQFPKFDSVADSSDHHFIYGAGKGLMLQPRAGWSKKVQKEWSILEKDLPETIYVRIYEERMDLLRAVIVGAPGTPYHDGLFFFDIFLPPEYPNEPPVVHYNSGGLRVNPNLYESGKVCLSLLNTWTGTGSEVWNPGSSTILQVLLSLQALVLNEKPYFNEAGYDKQMGRAEGEKNSVSYNENAFLMTCKSMLYLLRKPPKHFEAFVDEHFNARAQYILSACEKYMEGGPVGSAFGCRETEQEKGSSMGFKIMLGKLFPKLVEAFSGKGIDCSGCTAI